MTNIPSGSGTCSVRGIGAGEIQVFAKKLGLSDEHRKNVVRTVAKLTRVKEVSIDRLSGRLHARVDLTGLTPIRQEAVIRDTYATIVKIVMHRAENLPGPKTKHATAEIS